MTSSNRTYLTLAELIALSPGRSVIDAAMDVSTKREDGLWEGAEMAPITSAKLIKYGPIRPWVKVPRR